MDKSMNDQTTQPVRPAPNPTGKGGFGDHPENANPGGRPKNNERYGYWLDYFKNINEDEFRAYPDENKGTMSMACIAAYARISGTVKHLDEFKEVANRTEGQPKQTVEVEGGFFSENKMIIELVEDKNPPPLKEED